MTVSQDIHAAITEWCQYHYQDNLVGLALFDPTPVRPDYPHGDINVLILLDRAPAEERDRYDAIALESLKSVVPNRRLTCRIQTAGEIDALANLRLPLLAIYLTTADVPYDPRGFLQKARATLGVAPE